MHHQFTKPACPLLVFTDLDGTLLDHDSYSFAAARPALERLAALGVPVIPVTSKTLAELDVLTETLALNGPCIAENGGLIAYPDGYFGTTGSLQQAAGYRVEYLSPQHAVIRDMLNELRTAFGFGFSGFSDMTEQEVVRLTGLGLEDARRARRRLCSEPLSWNDSDSALQAFVGELDRRGYSLLKGGRFHHVLGKTDKAVAIDTLKTHFSQAGFSAFTSVALGDSPNDRLMLEAADIAVIVRRKDGSWLDIERHGETVRTRASGPAGWNEFFRDYLDRLAGHQSSKRTLHG